VISGFYYVMASRGDAQGELAWINLRNELRSTRTTDDTHSRASVYSGTTLMERALSSLE
jgi:hypothetical protein